MTNTSAIATKPVTFALISIMHPIVELAHQTRRSALCVLTRGMWSRYMIEMGESPNAMPCERRGVLGASVMLVDGEHDECEGVLCEAEA